MQLKKLGSLLLVCAMVFALLLTGCNTPAEDADGTTTKATTTTATDGGDVTEPSGDATEPSGDATEPSGDATEPSGDATEPSGDATQPGGDATQPGGTTTKPVSGTTTKKPGTTTSATKGTTVSSVYNTPMMPSFVRNDDGTCTDIKTNVIFIDDDCDAAVELGDDGKKVNNGTKLHDSSAIGVDRNQKEFFGNDGGRYIRYPEDAGAWRFTYKLTSGISEVAIQSFTHLNAAKTAMINGFKVYVSANGRSGWTEVALKYNASADSPLGSEWVLRTYTATGIKSGSKYLKVEFDPVGKGDPFYTPNISRVRINNIDKMNEADRFLEGRVSKIFYVDNKNGNDKNDGTSEAKAWKTLGAVNAHYYQPGDKILFKSGDTFTGTLNIQGYGTAKDRLTIGTYGGTKKAKIFARGEVKNIVNIAADYFTVENLEITGSGALTGMQIGAGHGGANKGIVIQNCHVHDINTNDDAFAYGNAGINLNSTGTEPTWFDGAVVRNNTVENVARVGIYLTGAWGDRPGAAWGASGELYKNDNDGWWPNANCSISGNTILDAHGDAILVIGAKDVTIEKNFVNNAFCVPVSKFQYIFDNGWNIASAAVWVANTNNAVMQYNDVGYTHLEGRFADGEAFDIDGANKETYVQYNYSHDNMGGFLLMCEFEEALKYTASSFHHIRFNLSVNDATKAGQGVFMATASKAQMYIYNNTIVKTTTGSNAINVFGDIENYLFQNNIFYGEGCYNLNLNANCTNVKFDNNVFTGGTPVASKGATVSGVKNQNPNFKNAAFTNPKQETSKMADALKAFVPQAKISGATNVKNNGGKDINGTKFDTLNFYGCIKY